MTSYLTQGLRTCCCVRVAKLFGMYASSASLIPVQTRPNDECVKAAQQNNPPLLHIKHDDPIRSIETPCEPFTSDASLQSEQRPAKALSDALS